MYNLTIGYNCFFFYANCLAWFLNDIKLLDISDNNQFIVNRQ